MKHANRFYVKSVMPITKKIFLVAFLINRADTLHLWWLLGATTIL